LEETLKSSCTWLLVLTLFTSVVVAQSASPARTDLYHVHFAKAALGKAVELADYLKTADPKVPMSAHRIVLRHQDGEDWDYAVIEHLGTKTTVEAAGTAVPAAVRDLYSWHTDSFVSGPSWAEFSKALGIDEGSAGKTGGSVYSVSVYRAAPGHREQLEKSLNQVATADTASGTVLLQHVEGGPWQFLSVVRYSSWQDFANGEKSSVADSFKAGGGWLGLREHSTYHNDTLTDRIAP
jgi:heme-degrading monooxygenase HmoA